jgi:hypothetical protein
MLDEHDFQTAIKVSVIKDETDAKQIKKAQDLIDFGTKNLFNAQHQISMHLTQELIAHPPRSIPELTNVPKGFLGPKIRASYSDTLSSEDPTVTILDGAKQPTAVKDITGALFSYTKDFVASSDAWVAKGAVLAPYVKRTDTIITENNGGIVAYGVIPSISFDRETNNQKKASAIDSLIFRTGVYEKYETGGPLYAQTFRLFGTYGTDFEFRSQNPAMQFEYEPQININKYLGTDSTYSLISVDAAKDGQDIKEPVGINENDPTAQKTILAYSLRAYLHGEYGNINEPANKIGIINGDFFRVGPKMEFKLAPFFTKNLSLTASYSYLPDIIGHNQRNDYLELSAEYDIITQDMIDKDGLTLPLVGVKATYDDGGIDLTKQKVQSFLVGLSISL